MSEQATRDGICGAVFPDNYRGWEELKLGVLLNMDEKSEDKIDIDDEPENDAEQVGKDNVYDGEHSEPRTVADNRLLYQINNKGKMIWQEKDKGEN